MTDWKHSIFYRFFVDEYPDAEIKFGNLIETSDTTVTRAIPESEVPKEIRHREGCSLVDKD